MLSAVVPASVQPCAASAPQHLILSANGRIQTAASNDLCLSSKCVNGGMQPCYPLYFTPCAATTAQEQHWSFDTSTSAFHPASNAKLCLDIASGGKGSEIGLYSCLSGDAAQQWIINSIAPSITTKAVSAVGKRCMAAAPMPPPPLPITLEKSGMNKTFHGLGAISGGGATSRMLLDYPAQQQSEILDYLFKPSFGASLHMLKVEIGGDMLSTDGSESSHMHQKGIIDLHSGYEWWLMQEAKKRNPEIKLYGLPWAYPGWVGNDPVTGAHNSSATPFTHPTQTAEYILEWVKGAKTEYSLDIDYVGIWNESPSDREYVLTLRKTLDAAGFAKTQIVWKDGGGPWCDDLVDDPEYAAAVGIIGFHYPGDFNPTQTASCEALGKPLWASEESSSFDDLNGAACWARVTNSHFVRGGITSSIMWNLLGAYAPGTSWFASSLLQAIEPWSGHYSGGGSDQFPVVWATAHLTQFAKIGWKYLDVGTGSGELANGGYYTTIVDPAAGSSDFALHIVKNSLDHAACTRPGLPPTEVATAEDVNFILSESMGHTQGAVSKLACWRSNFELETAILFEPQADVTVAADGSFKLHIVNGDYWTISTVRTATHGTFANPVPTSQSRAPSTLFDNFDHYGPEMISQQPTGWMQMIGAFEIHNDASNASNKVLRQVATQISLTNWRGSLTNVPGTVAGMREWQDIMISVSFRLPAKVVAPWWPSANSAACIGTRVDWTFDRGVYLCIGASGVWNVTYSMHQQGSPLMNATATGKVSAAPTPGTWHTMSLSTLKGSVTATYDNARLYMSDALRTTDTGFAALLTPGYYSVEFDNVAVTPVGPDWVVDPTPPSGCPSKGSVAKAGQKVFARRCQTNGITAKDEAFVLVAQSWHIRHIASGLCVTAASGVAGATLTLEACTFTDPLQAWQNDYSNIHHQNKPLTLMQYNLSLGAGIDGVAMTMVPGSDVRSKTWTTWSVMDSTHQLRNSRTPMPLTDWTGLGDVMCLSLCKDDDDV